MYNNSSIANATSVRAGINFQLLMNVQHGLYSVYILIGAPLNLWCLIALLRSPEVRARLRNKLISSMLLAQLLETGVIIPTYLILGAVVPGNKISVEICWALSIVRNLTTMQDFIVNWTIVIMLAVFLAQINDFDLSNRLTPLALRIVRFGILAIPWLTSLFLIPIITKVHSIPKLQRYCVLASDYSMVIFKSLDCIVPLLVAVCLLVTVAIMRRRRFGAGSAPGVMKAELIGRGPEIDSLIPYFAILCVAIAFDVPFMSRFFTYISQNYATRIIVSFVTYFFAIARCVVMPAMFLLFPDIRDRLKTWRPWYRPGQGIDLTVGYSVEQA